MQTMLANVTLYLRTISKYRTIATPKADIVKLLYFKNIVHIILFPTFVAFDRGDFFGSLGNFLVLDHPYPRSLSFQATVHP